MESGTNTCQDALAWCARGDCLGDASPEGRALATTPGFVKTQAPIAEEKKEIKLYQEIRKRKDQIAQLYRQMNRRPEGQDDGTADEKQ